jgi:hypothetical protein
VRFSSVVLVFVGFFLSACASGNSSLDLGPGDEAGGADGSSIDGTVEAAGPTGPEGGSGRVDSTAPDSSEEDAEGPTGDDAAGDVASSDASEGDAGPLDAGSDTGSNDAAPVDSSVGDGAPADAADAASCGSPAGSYSGTCNTCSLTGTTLSCNCLTDAGAPSAASLNLCTCPQPPNITNANGGLNCCGIPSGSYTATCSDCTTTGNTLLCSCLNDSQKGTVAMLDLCTCSNTTAINNQNGTLQCP